MAVSQGGAYLNTHTQCNNQSAQMHQLIIFCLIAPCRNYRIQLIDVVFAFSIHIYFMSQSHYVDAALFFPGFCNCLLLDIHQVYLQNNSKYHIWYSLLSTKKCTSDYIDSKTRTVTIDFLDFLEQTNHVKENLHNYKHPLFVLYHVAAVIFINWNLFHCSITVLKLL